MENIKNNNSNSYKNISTIEEIKESIKDKLIGILVNQGLIFNWQISNIKNLDEVYEYIKKLYIDKSINKEKYLQILFKWWIIKLWQILISEKIISDLQLEMALKIQKKHYKNKSLWDIIRNILLNNETDINNQKKIKKLFKILEELWIIRLWEYLISQNIINEEELSEYIEYQKEKNISLWKILIIKNKLTKDQLNEILNKLLIKINIDDLYDNDIEIYELKK